MTSKVSKQMPLSPCQTKTMETIIEGKNVFITGGGGCGKSYLLRVIAEWFKLTLSTNQYAITCI